MEKRFRIEKDAIGEKKIPKDAYYGIFTARAANNFEISGLKIPKEMKRAYIAIKIAAAQANMELKVLDKKKGGAIVKAGKRLLKEEDKFNDQFFLDVFQAGAGTPWHMNVNEVMANLALEILSEEKGNYKVLDPHDHVNIGQSSNDVTPSAIRIACVRLLEKLVFEVKVLIGILNKKAKDFKKYVKAGRTHLMDAVPITLGQEFSIWACDIESRLKNLILLSGNLRELPLGGTAVGTGFNAPEKFGKVVIKKLNKNLSGKFRSSGNKGVEIQFMGDFLDFSGGLRSLAVDLGKICDDLRILASGPMTGFNEIRLPEVEPGSSIMPGKFNPSMVEMMNMVCYQVIGNDETIRRASEAGQIDLNAMTPVIAYNLLFSLEILANGINKFNGKCVKGIKANRNVLKKYFDKNLSVATVLNPIIGYDRSVEVVKEAIRTGKSVKNIVLEKKILNNSEVEKIFSEKNLKLR